MLSGSRILNDEGRQNHGRQSGPTGISHAAPLGFQHLYLSRRISRLRDPEPAGAGRSAHQISP